MQLYSHQIMYVNSWMSHQYLVKRWNFVFMRYADAQLRADLCILVICNLLDSLTNSNLLRHYHRFLFSQLVCPEIGQYILLLFCFVFITT